MTPKIANARTGPIRPLIAFGGRTMTTQEDSQRTGGMPATPAERQPSRKLPKPPKPRKVEKRQRGRKG
jgi:hypothetical protein